MKLATKMFLGAATLALVPVLLTSLLVGGGSVQLARESLTQAAQAQLTSLREVRKQQVGDYVNGAVNTLQAFGATSTTVEAYKNFRQSFALAATEAGKGDSMRILREDVKVFYEKQFAEEFARKNPTLPSGIDKGLINYRMA